MTVTEVIEAIKLKYPTLTAEIEVVDNEKTRIHYATRSRIITIILRKKLYGFLVVECLIQNKPIHIYENKAFDSLTEMMEVFNKYVKEVPKYKQISLFEKMEEENDERKTRK